MVQPNYYNTPQPGQNPMMAAQGQQQQGQQQQRLLPGQIPGFQNLEERGRIPVAEFVGRYVGWALAENQYGQSIVLSFDNVQILASDAPWPYSEVNLQIRYSNSTTSGFGIFGISLAAALGIAREACDLENTKNQFLHIVREDEHYYGINPQTNQAMTGVVWHVVQAVQPGAPTPVPVKDQLFPKQQMVGQNGQQPAGQQPQQQPMMGQGQAPQAPAQNQQMQQPQQPMQTQQQPQQPAPAVATQPAPAPANPQPAQNPVPANMPVDPPPTTQPVGAPQPVAGTVTPEDQALKLLHGKDRDSWVREVMNDQLVQSDANLFSAILNNQWLANMIGAGRVTQNQDGTYNFVG